ncbi:MAG: hypothetical protein V4735_03585 [Pseudomonadota bacterium]
MISSYVIVLCLSAFFAAYAFTRTGMRIAVLLGVKSAVPEGIYALLAAIAFLVVVAAPATLLVSTLLLLGTGLIGLRNYLPPIARWGVPLLAALLSLSPSTMPAIAHVPQVFVQCLALVALFGLVMSATRLPDNLQQSGLGLLLALLPPTLAPLLFASAPSFLALDAVLIAASLLGVLLARRQGGRLGLARAPLVLLLGWLMIQCVVHGAWPCALASLCLYGIALSRFLPSRARAS